MFLLICKQIKNICGIYLLWIFLHFTAAQLYVKFCTYNSVSGFLLSPFLANSIHCNGLRWTINQGAMSINSMWIVLGTYISSKLIEKNNI